MKTADVRKEMIALAERGGGKLTPQQVVDAAREPTSPLHNFFTWDNQKAADARRLDEARHLIRTIKVQIVTTTRSFEVPYFVRNPELIGSEPGYTTTLLLRSDADQARDAIVREFQAAAAALRRARDLAEALQLTDEVDSILDGVVEIQKRIEAPAPAATQ